jgi:hypothetical protein
MLTLQTRPVDRLIPHVRNARTHSDEQVAQIATSITEFGFVNAADGRSERRRGAGSRNAYRCAEGQAR